LPLPELVIGIAAFASTNIDDLFLLAAWFADARLRTRAIVIGQYLGIGALVLASALAALLALALPAGWVALLGVVPLLLGISRLLALRTDSAGADDAQPSSPQAGSALHAQVLAVAGVTVANGGDNLGVYVPLFATEFASIAIYALTFAVMTGVWCAAGFLLVRHRILGAAIRRTGHVLLPLVLVALGVYILSGALVLLR